MLSVFGPPTISESVFCAVLDRHNSPAYQETFPDFPRPGTVYYAICVNRGINPAVALAFFKHESQFATWLPGVVVRFGTKNWGNLRPAPDGSKGRAAMVINTPWRQFRLYKYFAESLRDWCDLWKAARYQIPKDIPIGMPHLLYQLGIYAPKKDGNDPQAYYDDVAAQVRSWAAESGPEYVKRLAI